MKTKLAIIGTGMAGLACADQLSQQFDISLFDKSRGLSGRCSTRRAKSGDTAFAFDHGAQYFSAKEQAFVDWLKPFEAAGHIGRWQPRQVDISEVGTQPRATVEKFVFTPGMNAIGRALAGGRPQWRLYLDTQITAIGGAPGGWRIVDGEGQSFGPFDKVVLAIPAPQAADLVAQNVAFAKTLNAVEMQGCHSLMLGYMDASAIAPDWHCAHFDDAMLGFAALNSAKPRRGGSLGLVVQARHDWSQAHIDQPLEVVAQQMKQRFQALTGLSVEADGYDRIHRWRYASAVKPADVAFLHDAAKGLAAIGDWCTGSKVEDAFMSGYRLAEKLNAQ